MTAPMLSHLQPVLAEMRTCAHDSRPAYAMAGLCALAMPFGFGHALQTAKKEVRQRLPRLVPPFWQSLGFGFFFAFGGYMIDQGDVMNGSGVITAWSLTYVTFKTLPILRYLHRSPLSLLLSLSASGIGLGVYGNYYFDETSWRGAVPGMTPPQTVTTTPSQKIV
ncbi:hypothetical protein ACI68E_000808 [Malassezia pachydermatis]|uniref:Uncharacterized protein n=1 Tax=Malassezia pachydermatis TaxID=77020 RepID=A0A0M8MXD8_9BASI|nr:hypothetical protein Malapachy_2611 [Malassezia pachydermatis]KOS15461.1 hypothetical protein Malapachy_2611 [Malassezia pachydermatis]